ncbi:MAG: ATP-binding protein [Bacteroidota bacterium]
MDQSLGQLQKIIFIQSLGQSFTQISLDQSTLILSPEPSQSLAYLQVFRLFFGESWNFFLGENDDKAKKLFPEAKSWIIFQAKNQIQTFSAAFYWDKGIKVSFIQNPFEEELFLGRSQKSLSPTELFKSLRSKKIYHSDPIASSQEYRNILYGKLKGAAKKKWASFEFSRSSHPQDWLDQLQHAEQSSQPIRLKRTLLRSVADTLILDPKVLSQQVKDFHKNWTDVQIFERNESRFQALNKHYQQFQDTRKYIAHLQPQLQAAAREAESAKARVLTELTSIGEQSSQELHLYVENIQEKRDALYQTIKSLGLAEERVSRAAKKIAQYRGIEVPTWKANWEEFLKTHLPEMKPAARKASTQSMIEAAYEPAKTKAVQQYVEEIQQHHQAYEQTLTETQSAFYHHLQAANARISQGYQFLSSQPSQVQAKEEHSAPIQEAQFQHQLEIYRSELEHLESSRKGEQALIEWKLQAAQEKNSLKQAPIQQRLDQLHHWIDKRNQSFFGWLENRYPGWQKTIGKVIKEEVLFHSYLNPSVVRLNDLLYGIHLDLGEVEKKGPTTEELYQEVDELKFQLEALQKVFQEEEKDLRQQQESLEKKYRQRIRQVQKNLNLTLSEIEQIQAKKQRETVSGSDRIIQHQQQEKVHEILESLAKHREDSTQSLHQMGSSHLMLQDQVMTSRETFEARLKTIDQEVAQTIQEVNGSPKKKSSLKLDSLETLFTYWHDKAQYINPQAERIQEVETLKKVLRAQENALEEARATHTQRQIWWSQQENQYKSTLEKIDQALQRWHLWQQAAPPIEIDQEEETTQGSLTELLDEVLIHHQLSMELTGEISTEAHNLRSYFGPSTIFNWPESFQTDDEVFSWLATLQQWDENQTLQKIKDEISQAYATLIHRVGESYSLIKEIHIQVQAVLRDWNQALHNMGDELGWLSIQLSPSQHPVWLTLQKVYQLSQDSGFMLGGNSLFNPQADQSSNQQALEYLSEWNRHVQYGESIRLEDAFVLQFMMRTNQNELIPWSPQNASPEHQQKLHEFLETLISFQVAIQNNLHPIHLYPKNLAMFSPSFMKKLSDWASGQAIILMGTSTQGQVGTAFDQVIWDPRQEGKGWMVLSQKL